MANTDLRYLSASFRETTDPTTRRRTGEGDMVLQCATVRGGSARYVVIDDIGEAMELIEDLSRLVNQRRRIERDRAEREATR
jgi:hypothetical protein